MKYTGIQLILINAVLLFMVGCNNIALDQSPVQKSDADSVKVFTLVKDSLSKELSFPAELIPQESAAIYAKVSGYINDMKVDIGDRVKKGQILLVLDAPEMKTGLAQAASALDRERARLAGSRDAFQRVLQASQVAGTIAAGELEKAHSQMMTDSASMEASRSSFQTYSEVNNYLVIRAPFNGIVTQRNIDKGTLVNTGSTQPMLVVENNNLLRLRIPVPEAYSAAVPASSTIKFTLDADPATVHTAHLARKSGSLDLTTRTEIWEYTVDNANGLLKSGMFANAQLKLGRKAPTFLVLSSAIATNLEKRFVIRISNQVAEWVDVRNGLSIPPKMEIFGALKVGDTLVLRASDEIRQGRKVLPALIPR